MGLQYEEDNSWQERLRQEIRNPSMRTISLIVIVVVVVISAPFAPSWISQAREGVEEVSEGHELDRAFKLPNVDLTREQIAPRLIEQAETMRAATGPLEWDVVNFRFGPCSDDELSEMPDDACRATLTQSCAELSDIQGRYKRDCNIAFTCAVKDEAKAELDAVSRT